MCIRDRPHLLMWGSTTLALFFIHHGCSSVKRHGCQFICLVVIAIFIEVVHSLNIDKRCNTWQKFWKCWFKAYLPTVWKREKWKKPCRCFMRGDLALIADESIPCGKRGGRQSNWSLPWKGWICKISESLPNINDPNKTSDETVPPEREERHPVLWSKSWDQSYV